jgi:PAS domain S-box-containing protein
MVKDERKPLNVPRRNRKKGLALSPRGKTSLPRHVLVLQNKKGVTRANTLNKLNIHPGLHPTFTPASTKSHYDYVLLISPDGTVLSCDESLPERLGVPFEEFLGANLYSFFPPDIAAARRAAAEEVLRSGEPAHYRDKSKSGKIFETRILPLFEKAGTPSALAVCVHDVTSENQAVNHRRKLTAAVEQAAETVVIVDLDFRIEYVNQAFESMTGYSRRESRGLPVEELFTGATQKEKFARGRQLLENGEVWTDRFILKRRSGDSLICDQIVSPVRVKFGVVLGYVFAWRDSSHVSALEKQLRYAQKMEAVGALAGGIAHDFNNILGPIVLHAELCMSRIREDDPARASLPEILGAAKRAKSLVDQLLHLGRAREGDTPVPFGLGALIKECLKLLKPCLAPDIKVRLENSCSSDLILADPNQAHQVIMNLSTNAAEAMKDSGGRLTFSLADVSIPDSQNRQILGLQAGEFVKMTVRDTGYGINSGALEKIFEPFYTTKNRTGGAGLGLSVVKSILTGLGGYIDVESQPGAGSAFHVYFPKAMSAPEELLPQETLRPITIKRTRILFVDDDPVMAKSVSMTLKDLGFSVTTRTAGALGLHTFAQKTDEFDLALLDFVMPYMNGLTLAKELWRLRPDIPVILFSAYSDKILPNDLWPQGLKAFLAKPFDIAQLTAAIRNALRNTD